ncbi:MAG: YebC/PmpR family DNA-binding transcriptional regulator [Pseudomonadota bacterium]|nr:YebC/PmpR family DNA-binding transcriptional regulator [Pseudomonadota bacterium]MDE3037960.1 YebC/PmpR family DNA-binding transcriptional regulator [Pseudomonadota bacterium]
MAGHSHFKNVMRRKGAQDARKAKILTKVQREIISACKTGAPDPNANPRLRAAIQWAREENMPRDRIEAAIKRGAGNIDTDHFEAVRYEGYGPGGAALIVQALTDNRNRTASEVRSAFDKFGGSLGETGSVGFMFDYAGRIAYPAAAASEEAMFEAALEAGAEDCSFDGGAHIILCASENFAKVRDALEKKSGSAESAKLTWLPKTTTPVNEDQAGQLLRLIDALEDSDDVQEVFSNFEIPEAMLQKLSA